MCTIIILDEYDAKCSLKPNSQFGIISPKYIATA